MEKITEIGGEIDREKEASTSAPSEIDNDIDKHLDIQLELDNLSCATSQRTCCLTEQTSTKCGGGQLSDYPVAERTTSSRIFYNFKLTMLLQYSKEFLGFFALILTTYATLLNKEPVIGGTVSPKPIFAKGSIVQEWPYGHLLDVQSKVAASELSLIFFYAPWCAESLFAKRVYNSVANLYSREAYFAAVNCWQPSSGCRTNYSNVYKWPVLMAYFPNAFSVQYSGTWSYNSLTKFIDRLLMPIVRIHDMENLMQLRIANDAVVFGVFKSLSSKEYQIFFQTAVKWLESKSFQNVKFAIYIGEETSIFLQSEPVQAPVIKLFTTSDAIVYNNTKWVSTKIINFIKQLLSKSNIWINLSSTKSSAIHKYLQRGPVLLMFSPRVSSSHHYFIMKQLIYSYNKAQHDLNNTVLNNYITHIQKEYPAKFKKLTQLCESAKNVEYQDIQSALFDVGVCEDRLFSLGLEAVNTSKVMSSDLHISRGKNNCNYRYCEREPFRNNINEKSGIKQKLNRVDYRSPSEILRSHLQKQCFQLEKLPQTVFQKAVVEPINTSKLLPRPEHMQNRTLTFLMLDSMVYSDYLRNFIGDFGIHRYPSPSPALFVIDNNEETLYMQKSKISTSSAVEFVNDFYNGKLRRHLRSSRLAESHNHSSVNSHISIREVNSRQFSKIIQWTNATSVVLFYSPQCSLCYIMSQTLLQISHIMQLKNIQFYRIDGSVNDVCWEYTMHRYPTLIVFPQNRSFDTNVFPSALKINVKNVFGFILSKLKPEQQLKSLINACILTKLSVAFQSCVRQVREMINNEISRCLHQWNRSPSHRTLILKRLNIFKEIYLESIRARKGSDLEYILKDIITYENGNYSYSF